MPDSYISSEKHDNIIKRPRQLYLKSQNTKKCFSTESGHPNFSENGRTQVETACIRQGINTSRHLADRLMIPWLINKVVRIQISINFLSLIGPKITVYAAHNPWKKVDKVQTGKFSFVRNAHTSV